VEIEDMATPVIMPRFGQAQKEATVVEWFKEEGEQVKQGEPLLSVETDKVVMEVEAPASGVLLKVMCGPDDVVPIATVIAYIGESGEGIPKEDPAPGTAGAMAPLVDTATAETDGARSDARPDKVRATPAARGLARQTGIDITAVTGTGHGGLVTRDDVERFAQLAAPSGDGVDNHNPEVAMPFEIRMPQLGWTMETGTVEKWLVKIRERFAAGQEILEVETDKAILTVEAHQAGIIERILVAEGQEVPIGTALAVAVAPGERLPADWQPSDISEAPASVLEPSVAAASHRTGPGAIGKLQASWKARTVARQTGLDLETIAGSGPAGRIVAEDVTLALDMPPSASGAAAIATPVASRLADALGLYLSKVQGSGPHGRIVQSDVLVAAAALIHERAESLPIAAPGPTVVASTVPLISVRRIVSKRMAISAQTTARVTLFREVDASALVHLRERFSAQGVQISYNDILIRICAIALGEHRHANARIAEDRIEYLGCVNIGLAVQTDRGLLVPVIRDADTLTIPQIAAETRRLTNDARAGRNLPDDLTGGTFTITNLGMLGVEGFTPVINLPECCILGVGCIVRKPVVIDENDTVAVRPVTTLSLVFDHRVLDGAAAARFLARIAQLIHDPLLLLTVN
jgi:pyruvate/2-oxoglutarate dehydrogenase complex dihydrolipoamide acyltransferase (E2) component